MKLYVNRPSPYGRKAVVAAMESGLDAETEIVQVDPWKNAPEFLAAVPAGRVPALLFEDGSVLLESTAIAHYLLSRRHAAGVTGNEPDQMQRTGLAQALMDAAYNSVIERRRPPELQWADWISRQHAAIGRMLAACAVPSAERFDLGDITLACALAYLDFRLPEMDWRAKRQDLGRWLAEVARRPSMVASDPRQP